MGKALMRLIWTPNAPSFEYFSRFHILRATSHHIQQCERKMLSDLEGMLACHQQSSLTSESLNEICRCFGLLHLPHLKHKEFLLCNSCVCMWCSSLLVIDLAFSAAQKQKKGEEHYLSGVDVHLLVLQGLVRLKEWCDILRNLLIRFLVRSEQLLQDKHEPTASCWLA